MNFYALKTKFKEFLLNQGLSSGQINQEKDFDNLSIFTYNSEFKDFINQEYEMNLEDEYSELSELFDSEVKDGKFVLDEEKANDKESAFMVDMVNNLIEDEDFVKNIDEYAANDNQENSTLDLLSDLFKEKGITQGDTASGVDASAQGANSTGGTQGTSAAPASVPSAPTTNNLNKTPVVPDATASKDYSQMNTKELQEAHDEQKNEISQQNQGVSDTISQNQTDIANAKAEYDAAMEEDNVDPALLESRNQNLEAITQTDNAINELTSTISTLDSEISVLDSDISVLDSSISALNSSLASLPAAPEDDPEAQAAIAAQRASIEAQISQLTSEKDNLTSQKTDLETQKTDAETNLNQSETQLQQLETEKANIEDQILQTCNENTKAALENYNQVRDEAKANLQTAKESLRDAQNELKEIGTHLQESKAKDIERENRYREKGDAFSENGGFELIKGEGDTDMSYSIIKPKNLDPNEEVPVMVYLHGSGGNERSLYNQIMDEYNLAEGFNGYIICPTAQGYWDNERSAQNIDQILNTFAQTHKIDANNITVVGHSMGGTGALYMADSEVFKDDEGFKFSKAAAITGYPNTKNDYDIPVALYVDSGSKYALENHILNPDSEDRYVDWVGESHTNMDNRAFTEDADGDGKADLLEWLYDDN